MSLNNRELKVDKVYSNWQWQTAFELACHCLFYNWDKRIWISLGLNEEEREIVWNKAKEHLGVKNYEQNYF